MDWRVVASAVAWTTVLGMAVARGFSDIPQLTVWALFAGQIALVFTGWLIGERLVATAQAAALERQGEIEAACVERVARRITEMLLEEQDNVSPLR